MDKHKVQIAVIVDGKVMRSTEVTHLIYNLFEQIEKQREDLRFTREPDALAALCERAYTDEYTLERAAERQGDSFVDALDEQEVFDALHDWYGTNADGTPDIKYAKVFKVQDVLDGKVQDTTCISEYPDTHGASNPDWYVAAFDDLQIRLPGTPDVISEVTVHEFMGYPFTGPQEQLMVLYKYNNEYYVKASEHARYFPCD